MVKKESIPDPVAEFIWHAPELESVAKSPAWYLGSLVIALLLFGLSLWQGNFLFAIFIVLAEIIIFFFSAEPSRVSAFRASSSGLEIDSRFYPWSDFSEFSIGQPDSNRQFVDLYLYKNNHLSFDLKLKISQSEVAKVRSFLHNYLTEVEHEDSLIDSLTHFLGF